MNKTPDVTDWEALRDHITAIHEGGQAFDRFEEIVREFPPNLRGEIPCGMGHSAWQILEHMRITQRDILDFSRNENGTYTGMTWPDDYWPKAAAPPAPEAWDKTVTAFLTDRSELEALVRDPAHDLLAPFPWGDGQTLLREALLAAEHAAYHLGQLVIVRRMLDGSGI